MAAMINDHWLAIVVVPIVIFAISSICHLFLLVIHDNYIFPPTRWTVKVFLVALFILRIPSICVTWICAKLFVMKQQLKGGPDEEAT